MTSHPEPAASRPPRRELDGVGDGPPFGLTVLDEVPELADMLGALADADAAALRAVLAFKRLAEDGRAEETTGVGLDHWTAACARACRLDRSMLRRVSRLLDRLPAIDAAARDGRVSFSQLRSLALELRGVPIAIDDALDTWLAAAIEQLAASAEPDVLVSQARKAIGELWPQELEDAEQQAERDRYLVLEPNLLGTGGRFHGYEDALGLAALDAATAPRHDQLDDTPQRARADNLQRVLNHECDPDAGGDGSVNARGLPPRLLIRCDLDSLLDRTATPADILTRLVGGQLRLTSAKLQELVAARGAQLRTIVVDGGEVIGVGRAARIPSDWLRDVVMALHDTCSAPLCDRPALTAHIDHADDWWPGDPDAPFGRTDADNLGPLCGTTNTSKREAGWAPSQEPNGTRTWTHRRAGIQLTSVPATWRPSGIPPPPHRHHRDPPPQLAPRRSCESEDDLPF